MKRALLIAVAMWLCHDVLAEELSDDTFKRWVNSNGVITLPTDFRQSWVHIGSWTVADTSAPGHGFHDVYLQPEAVERFRAAGEFPDGTVLVKEVRTIESGVKTTGMASWAGMPVIWFVMVKDAVGRFDGNPHWANGWGWGLFEARSEGGVQTAVSISKGFVESCQGCHLPAKANDWVYLEGYPTLAR